MDEWSSIPNGRDGRGRFALGNPGGPGNPFAKRAAALRQAFYATATEADLQAIARQVVDKAKGGDLAAIKIALLWLLGKPAEPTDPDAPTPPARTF
jgi:hypothetical protein